MATVLINGISVKEGGSLVVLRELVAGIRNFRPQWGVHVVANSTVVGKLVVPDGVRIHEFPAVDHSFWRTRLWYETTLIRLLRDLNADLLFSHTNYLPSRCPPCRTLLLEQHAGHFSDVFQKLMIQSLGRAGRLAWRLKGRWVRASVKRADAVTVQTQALAKQIASTIGISRDTVHVIPHGVGQMAGQSKVPSLPHSGEPLRIGYITRYGVQKNFEVLFKAVAILKRKGLKTRLFLTLSPTIPDNQAVLELAKAHGVWDVVDNRGEVAGAELTELYESLHVFAFPSLCESFGFPLVEAMANGLPLVAADTESNREVAADGATYFPGNSAESLAEQFLKLASDKQWFSQRAAASLSGQREFSWATTASRIVSLIEDLTSIQQHKMNNAR